MDMNNIEPENSRAFHQAWRWQGKPKVSQDIHVAVNEITYRPFVAKTLSRVPQRFIPHLLNEYNARSANKEANEWLRDSIDSAFPLKGLSHTACDDQISIRAKIYSKNIKDILAKPLIKDRSGNPFISTPEQILSCIETYCINHDVIMPQCKTLLSTIYRVTDAAWWQQIGRAHV